MAGGFVAYTYILTFLLCVCICVCVCRTSKSRWFIIQPRWLSWVSPGFRTTFALEPLWWHFMTALTYCWRSGLFFHQCMCKVMVAKLSFYIIRGKHNNKVEKSAKWLIQWFYAEQLLITEIAVGRTQTGPMTWKVRKIFANMLSLTFTAVRNCMNIECE